MNNHPVQQPCLKIFIQLRCVYFFLPLSLNINHFAEYIKIYPELFTQLNSFIKLNKLEFKNDLKKLLNKTGFSEIKQSYLIRQFLRFSFDMGYPRKRILWCKGAVQNGSPVTFTALGWTVLLHHIIDFSSHKDGKNTKINHFPSHGGGSVDP